MRILYYAALLHDVGMTKLEALAKSKHELSDKERMLLKSHVQHSIEIVNSIMPDSRLAGIISKEISAVHERQSSEAFGGYMSHHDGYLGQMLGILDTYEAMTHPRPWREPITPFDAVKHILSNSGMRFKPELVRKFVELFSMFPPGSYVELSTGDIACVVMVNPGYLSRPHVAIVKARDSKAGHSLNLLDYPLIHIVRQIPQLEIEKDSTIIPATQEFLRLP
jgi:HD-GYP domain-containing protein (c-di-GMP phosphodiesterase class II)